MTRGERAKENFYKGYNCSQSVILAFDDLLPVDVDPCLKLIQGFGGGFSRLREVCGTVSGAVAVIGLIYGSSDPEDANAKKLVYSYVREVAARFEERYGTIICRELLGLKGKSNPVPEERTPQYYAKRPCPEIIESMADMLDEFLKEKASNKDQVASSR